MSLISGLLITLAILGGVFIALTIFAVVVPVLLAIVIGAVFLVVPIIILVRLLRWGLRG